MKRILLLILVLGALPGAPAGAQPAPPQQPPQEEQPVSGGGNAETLREGGKQYRQGNPLAGASDNRSIARQGLSDANLSGKKQIVDMKPNTFLSLWNNPGFAAQFEKFLSAPAETSEAAQTYRERIARIMELLSPGKASKSNQDEAFNLLTKASEFESDANICTTIHDAVYTAANVRTEIADLIKLNADLERQLRIEEYNNQQASRDRPLDNPPVNKNEVQSYNENQKIEREARMAPTKRQIDTLTHTIENNRMRIATGEASAKFQLQSLILQLFVQRRWQHVIIANRFYRAIFNDGDQSLQSFEQMADKLGYNKQAGQLKVVADAKPTGAAAVGNNAPGGAGAGAGVGSNGATAGVGNNNNNYGTDSGMALSGSGLQLGVQNASVESLMNAVSSGMRTLSKTFKTLSQLDGIANEIIRDVNEGVKVYRYLLEQNELESASVQLASVFSKGEYLPSVRLLSVEEKRRTLKYAQLCNRLINASNSGNIDAVSNVLSDIKQVNPGFDDAEIQANIQGLKTGSSLHVAQAKVAASRGDLQTVQAEITRAASLWPNNPEVTNFSREMAVISDKARPAVQATDDFDQLYAQKNYRRIFEEKEKYIAALSQSTPERQQQLREVMNRMQDIEASLMRAQEIDRRGDHAGAWEGLEMAFTRYPDDPKLSQMRADLTTQAPDFVHDIREAGSLEEKGEYGSSLAWYLRAQGRYPMSDLSKQGIQRVVKRLLPDAN